MRIVVDTREQRPLEFVDFEYAIEVMPKALIVGDYTAQYSDGSICPIYFERKSLPDLFGTMTHDYKRFKLEIERARANNLRLILAIEGTYDDVLAGYEYSLFSGSSMMKKLMTLWQKYDLTPIFFDNRQAMAHGIKEFYMAFGRNFKLKVDNGKPVP